MAEAGHTFLAKLGKTRLRPGGKEATDWLIDKGHFTENEKVLEVACNMCTTSMMLAEQYGCEIEAIDLNKKALEKGKENVQKHHLEHLIHIQQANAMNLPFEDETFNIVLNEAMLTMLPIQAKEKALKEYYRVLKPGGILLTHDIAIMIPSETNQIQKQLSDAINVKVTPLPVAEWRMLYQKVGFSSIESKVGSMSLMTPFGMIRDEGIKGTVKIVCNALKAENRQMFLTMFNTMKGLKKHMNYIVHAACK